MRTFSQNLQDCASSISSSISLLSPDSNSAHHYITIDERLSVASERIIIGSFTWYFFSFSNLSLCILRIGVLVIYFLDKSRQKRSIKHV